MLYLKTGFENELVTDNTADIHLCRYDDQTLGNLRLQFFIFLRIDSFRIDMFFPLLQVVHVDRFANCTLERFDFDKSVSVGFFFGDFRLKTGFLFIGHYVVEKSPLQ